MRRLIRRPSASMTVACLALFLALSGTGVADITQLARNTVGTPQIRNGAVTTPKVRNASITTAKVRNRAITLAKLAPNARVPGPQGPAGPAGAAGATGPAGPAGPGVTGLEVVQSISANDSANSKSQTASCPAGKRLLAGGASLSGSILGSVALYRSAPVSVGGTQWTAGASEMNANPSNWRLAAYAVCAAIP